MGTAMADQAFAESAAAERGAGGGGSPGTNPPDVPSGTPPTPPGTPADPAGAIGGTGTTLEGDMNGVDPAVPGAPGSEGGQGSGSSGGGTGGDTPPESTLDKVMQGHTALTGDLPSQGSGRGVSGGMGSHAAGPGAKLAFLANEVLRGIAETFFGVAGGPERVMHALTDVVGYAWRSAGTLMSVVRANFARGKAWERTLVYEYEAAGWLVDVGRGTGIDTPLGWRFPDLTVRDPVSGQIVLFVEAKTGWASYNTLQRQKDLMIEAWTGVPTIVRHEW